MSSPLSPARNTDLRQIVYEKIKEAIVDGVIQPGQRLSEVELADQLAVSRTPVREAIRQLAQTGLVTLISRRGAYVTLPTIKDAIDLYELRTALELLAMEHVCHSLPREEMEEYLSIFSEVTDDMPSAEFLARDRQFHGFISNSCNNHYLQQTCQNIDDHINLCRHYSVENLPVTSSAQEHVRIIMAMIEGDCEKAKAELKHHLDQSREALVTYLKQHRQDNNTL